MSSEECAAIRTLENKVDSLAELVTQLTENVNTLLRISRGGCPDCDTGKLVRYSREGPFFCNKCYRTPPR